MKYKFYRWLWRFANKIARWAGNQMITIALKEDKEKFNKHLKEHSP